MSPYPPPLRQFQSSTDIYYTAVLYMCTYSWFSRSLIKSIKYVWRQSWLVFNVGTYGLNSWVAAKGQCVASGVASWYIGQNHLVLPPLLTLRISTRLEYSLVRETFRLFFLPVCHGPAHTWLTFIQYIFHPYADISSRRIVTIFKVEKMTTSNCFIVKWLEYLLTSQQLYF